MCEKKVFRKDHINETSPAGISGLGQKVACLCTLKEEKFREWKNLRNFWIFRENYLSPIHSLNNFF